MKKIVFLLLINLIYTPSIHAAVAYKTGKVSSIKMFGNIVAIYVDSIDENACGSGQKRVAIKTDNPLYSVVVSSALAAKATGALVEISYYDSCNNQQGSWDFESFWIK